MDGAVDDMRWHAETIRGSITWKHGITRAELDDMSSEEPNELDEVLLLYLYQKLEGEPARWAVVGNGGEKLW